MPETFAPRPRATLRRGPTGAILSASIKVHRRPGESAAAFQCRIQRDFGAILEGQPEPAPDGPIRKGGDAPVSGVEWTTAPSGYVMSARLVPVDGSPSFTVPRDLWEPIHDFLGRLRTMHGASFDPLGIAALIEADMMSGGLP